MVVLSLLPYRGNYNRLFPYAGCLGVTPVFVQGTVRVELEEDRKPLKASSLVVRVRCYEVELSTNVKKAKRSTPRVLYESAEQVWANKSEDDWGQLGDLQVPFRIVLPIDAGGVSTLSFKTFRTWWQVEAVAHHKPSSVIGSRKLVSKQLAITRYSPSPLAYTLPSPSWTGASPLHGIEYSISADKCVYGPGDEILIDVFLRRSDPNVAVKKIHVSLHRHLIVDGSEASLPSSSDEDEDEDIRIPDLDGAPTPPADEVLRMGRSSSRRASSSASRSLSTGFSPLSSPSLEASEVESYFAPRQPFVAGPSGSGSSSPKNLARSSVHSFELVDVPFDASIPLKSAFPKANSIYRYSLGETLRTSIAHLYFTLSVKLHVRTKSGSVEVLDLEPRTVAITAASNLERKIAVENSKRLVAVADAERRIFEQRDRKPASPVKPVQSSLGLRRSSHFTMSVSTDEPFGLLDSETLPSPTRSAGSAARLGDLDDWGPLDQHRPEKSVRRRSEAGEFGDAPVKTRPKVSSHSRNRSPSPHPLPLPLGTVAQPAYVASSLGQYSPLVQQDSPVVEQGTLGPAFSLLPRPSSPQELTRRTSRQRLNRATGPYSRPRSVGGASISSQRSRDESSCGESISGLSMDTASPILKSGRFVREKSAPPHSPTVLSQEILLLPLSLYPRATDASIPPSHVYHSSIPVPASPCLSDCSSSSDASIPPPPSPSIDFNSFSLASSLPPATRVIDAATRSEICPWLQQDVGPFDRQSDRSRPRATSRPARSVASPLQAVSSSRRLSAVASPPAVNSLSPQSSPMDMSRGLSASNVGRRKSSIGFGLFSNRNGGDEDEGGSPKDMRWGFLRRGSKVST